MADIDFVGEALKKRPLGAGEARKPEGDIDFVGEALSFRQGAVGGPRQGVPRLAIQDPETPASFGTQFRAGLTGDINAKIAEFAEARGISPDRYGVKNGQIFFRADDGTFRFETAQKTTEIVPGVNIAPGKIKRAAAQILGHAPEIVAGTLAIPAGPLAVGAATAGGSLIRSGVSKLTTKDPSTPAQIGLRAGKSGVIGAVGEIPARVGIGIRQAAKGRAGARLARAAGRDRPRIDRAEFKRMDALAKKHGITLFTPQLAKSPELTARFNLLGDIPVTADKIGKAKLQQFIEVDKAVRNLVGTFVSPKTTALQAGEQIVKVAKAQIKRVKGIRAKITKPFYDEADKVVGVDISPAMEKIESLLGGAPRGSTEFAAINRVKKMLQREVKDPKGKVMLVPEDRLRLLDKVKKSINSKWKKDFQKAPEIETQSALNGVLTSMLKSTDEISEAYAKARKLFRKASPMVEKFTKGRIGQLAKLEGEDAAKAASKLFNVTDISPEMITRVKRGILRQKGGKKAWDNIIGIHMRAQLAKVKEPVTGGIPNVGGWFRQKVFGDPTQRQVMLAAMDKVQRKNFTEFMEVLDRTGSILGKESATATRLVSLGKQQTEAEGVLGKFIRASTRPLLTKKRIIGDYVNTIRTEKFQEKLADAMLSERAGRQLQNILKMDPKREVFTKRISLFLTQVAAGDFGGSRARGKLKDIKPKLKARR